MYLHSFRQRLRANCKSGKYVAIVLASLWISLAVAGCGFFSTNQSTSEPSEISRTAAERFDGITVNVLARAGTIGSGIARRIPDFEALTGAQVKLTTIPYGEIYDTLQTDWPGSSPAYDMAVASPSWLIDFVKASYLEDLTSRIEADEALAWDDVAPFFQNVSTAGDERIYGIPVDGDFHMVYYRTDLLNQAGLAPPATWEDYLTIAQQFHGQDLNGDSTPDYGSCFAKEPNHLGYFMMTSIATSYLQSQGTGQGTFFDLETMKPLVNNEAFSKALDIYKQTSEVGPPGDATMTQPGARELFMAGRCALTLDWGDVPILAADADSSNVVDMVGAAITPGAAEVLDRTTGKLVACDKFTCPYGINGINHAPYAANMGFVSVVAAKSEPTVKEAAYAFASFMSQPAQANVDVTIGETGFNPYRISQFENVTPWIESGMSAEAANNYLGALGVTLNNPNMALDLKLPYGKRYQLEVLDPAITAFMADEITRDEAIARIEQGWEAITNEVGREAQKANYRTTLGLSF
ncbi:MAG: extracellular solute-binding protein [Cyanobacteria bacterium P01_A01_bin.116]